jgi:hypothetical protein
MRLNLSKGLSHIQGKVSPNSITRDCVGEGCKVYRTNIPRQKVVINLEKEFDSRGDNSQRCDRLLFYRNKNIIYAVPIELKGGKGKESQVRAQLKNGLEFAASLVQGLNEPVYVPIVFTKKGIKESSPKHQKRELKVKFNGRTLNVLQGRCGRKKNLANVLSQAGYL